MTEEQPQATVTQADRDAANGLWQDMTSRSPITTTGEGKALGHDFLQAFARYRLSSALSSRADAIGSCIAMCERMEADKNLPTEACNAAWNLKVGMRRLLLQAPVTAEPVPAINQAGGVDGRFWLIVHEPGKVPDRKGSWPRSQLPQIMREFIAARPTAYLTVLTVGADGSPDVQHGPEALQMADGRSMRTGSAHNARTFAAHCPTAAATEVPQAHQARVDEIYLIRKNGMFYRPNAQGYTCDSAYAGRFTISDAIRHSYPNGLNGPRDGIDYMLADEPDAPDHGLADPVAWEPEVGSVAALARAKAEKA